MNVSNSRLMLGDRGRLDEQTRPAAVLCGFGTFVKHDAKLIDRLAERAQINLRYIRFESGVAASRRGARGGATPSVNLTKVNEEEACSQRGPTPYL